MPMSNVYICDLLKIHFRLNVREDQFFCSIRVRDEGM